MGIRIRDLLDLIRLPNVFTAITDALAGYYLAGGSLSGESSVGIICTASASAYAGGAALNDVCDVKQDQSERPERPIPAGRISRKTAMRVAVTMIGASVTLAGLVSPASLLIALALALCIVLYDAVFKDRAIGPVFMGLCRGLNLLLGMSAFWTQQRSALGAEPVQAILPCLIMTLYVASLTAFARRETSSGGRLPLVLAVAGMVILSASSLLLATASDVQAPSLIAFGLVLIVLCLGGRAALRPTPPRIQQAVRMFVLTLPLLSASMVAARRVDAAPWIVLAAAAPAWITRRIRIA